MTRKQTTSFSDDKRGQTVQDFAIGISMLLITIAFVFAVVPTIITPFFSPGDISNDLKADRAADTATDRYFIGNMYSDQTTTLDRDCTVAFFEYDNQGGELPDCPYDYDQIDENLEQALGIDSPTTDVYIQIEEFEGRDAVVEKEGVIDESSTITLSRGDEVTAEQEASGKKRVVHLDGQTYILRVIVS